MVRRLGTLGLVMTLTFQEIAQAAREDWNRITLIATDETAGLAVIDVASLEELGPI